MSYYVRKNLLEGRAYEEEANDVMTEDYHRYIEAHGYHFTDELADYASRQLVNEDGTSHRWSADEVRAVIESRGIECKNAFTIGDLTYIANWVYSDLYPRWIGSEGRVIERAVEVMSDADGYKGMPMMRWVSDLIGRKKVVPWKEFV